MPLKPHTILFRWLKKLRIPVSPTYIRQLLNSHPDYPSLLSITDTLDELGIDNTAIQIEKEQLHEMPVPFIAHLNGNGGEFVIVENRDNIDKQFPEFFKRWGGVAIAAEKQEGWQHKLNNEWLQKDRKQHTIVLLTLIALSSFILLSGVISFNWVQFGLLLTGIAGVFVSWMIVSKDLGIENKMADEVCGNTADCNTVIHSNTSKLPFGIGLSDGGIIYFLFLLLASVITSFSGTGSGILPVLFVLTACSLLLTIYSIYYQWQVAKKWCRLCLITSGLLWMQFVVLLLSLTTGSIKLNTISLNSITLAAFLLFATTAAWLWLKPLLKKYKELEKENFAGKRFKNNSDVFGALLEKQRKVDITPFDDDLQLGNLEAPLQIMVTCNPFCRPCAKAHEMLHELVEKNNIGLTVRFTVETDNKEDKKLQAVEYMLQLVQGKDAVFKRKVLHDWYEWMDLEKFRNNYHLNRNENIKESLDFLEKWSAESKIEFTPTVFINDFEMPKQYKVDDLSGLIRMVKDKLEMAQTELI